mgnify:CR=1 FL=1
MSAERYLVLDGSLGFCIVAIVASDGGEHRLVAEERNHRDPLMRRIAAILPDEERRLELAGVVVGTGPGSYTSIRVAAAAAAGIAMALHIPVRTSASDRAVLEAVGRPFSVPLGARESIEVTSSGSDVRPRERGSLPVDVGESAETVALSLVRRSTPETRGIILRYPAPARGIGDR